MLSCCKCFTHIFGVLRLARRGGLAQDDIAMLRPDKSRVKAAGLGGVAGAFDDGATIGKESQFIRIAPELEHELIMADAAVRVELAAHLAKIAVRFGCAHSLSGARERG